MYGKAITYWMNCKINIFMAKMYERTIRIKVVVASLKTESSFGFVMFIWLVMVNNWSNEMTINTPNEIRANISRFLYTMTLLAFWFKLKLNACSPLVPICLNFEPRIFVFTLFSVRFKWRSQRGHKRYACSNLNLLMIWRNAWLVWYNLSIQFWRKSYR